MSAWTSGGDPSSSWQHPSHPVQPHPATSQPSSIDPQYEAWDPQLPYPQGPESVQQYHQVEYASHGVDPYQYGSNQPQHFASASSQSHQVQNPPYPNPTYPQAQQHAYRPLAHNSRPAPPSSQPPYAVETVPSNSSFRYGPNPSGLENPSPHQSVAHLSATAQRFQNGAPSPSYEPSSALHPQPAPPQQIPPSRNYAASPRPTPAPATVQQYHRKVDELAMLEHRLSQLQSILSRGTMSESGPGAGQAILPNQRAHLEVQAREFKNRQGTLLGECEAFTRHFGPASTWSTPYAPQEDTSQALGYAGPAPRTRTISSGLPQHQQQQPLRTAPDHINQQNTYNGLPSGAEVSQYGTVNAQSYPGVSHERRISSNSYDAYPTSVSIDRYTSQPLNHHEVPGHSTIGNRQGPNPPPQLQYPNHPADQRYAQSSHPGPSPSYNHFTQGGLPIEDYQSPGQQQFSSLPPPPLSSHDHQAYRPPPTQAPTSNSPAQPFPYQQQQYAQPQATAAPLQPFPPQRPPSRPARVPEGTTNGHAPVHPQRPQLPPGLQAQIDALARDQANGRARTMTNPHAASQQTPLQTLIKKAENGEMPVMTMTGLKKQSEIDREKKLEEEREKAKASEAGPAPGPTAVEKTPTTVLAGICRQGGGPTLAEMVMTIDHQLFWTQLQQSCAKRNVNVFDEVHQGKFVVENKTVDLLQLFQTVVSRGGGYAKIDAGNAWTHVATLLSIPTRSAVAQAKVKEIYHRVLQPFEDLWATQMIKFREKQRAMDEARRVLQAMPAASSSQSNELPRNQPNPVLPQQQAVPSPLTTNSHLAPAYQPARRSPSQQHASTAPPPPQGSSSMFANPLPYSSVPPTANSYPAQSGPAPTATQGGIPTEKPVTSADLLEQARALRKNAVATAAAPSGEGEGGDRGGATNVASGVQAPLTTSPPQETSSTPQESVTASVTAPAPIVEAPSKPSPSSRPRSISNSQPLPKAIPGLNPPLPTSAAQDGIPALSSTRDDGVQNPKKRKNEETDEATTQGRHPKARDRSMSNIEAPIVGQQTNEPHFNPFEITHFLPFTTAAPSIVPSPTTLSVTPLRSLYPSDPNNSAKSTMSNPSLQPDTSSTSGDTTISPQSIGDAVALSASPGTLDANAQALTGQSGAFEAVKAPSNFRHSPISTAAAVDPSALDSISLSMSLDPLAASRPSTSWSRQDKSTLISNGLSSSTAFDSFSGAGGLDGYSFATDGFGDDDGFQGLDGHTTLGGGGHSSSTMNGTGIPNWSPGGLDGFDFGSTFS